MGPKLHASAPPAHLGEAGRVLWQTINAAYQIDDAVGEQNCCCKFAMPLTLPKPPARRTGRKTN